MTSAGQLPAATGAAAAIAAAVVPPLTASPPPSLPLGGTASAGAAEVVHCWAAEGVS